MNQSQLDVRLQLNVLCMTIINKCIQLNLYEVHAEMVVTKIDGINCLIQIS